MGLPFLVFFTMSGVVPLFSNRKGSVAFFQLAAQVIPVLLLAVAVENRFFVTRRIRDPIELLFAVVTLGAFGVGEFYALRSVEVGHGTEQAFGSVVAALAAGFVAVATLGLLEPRQASEDD